jgi:hypothetical protein
MIDRRILIMLCIIICSCVSCDKDALGPAEMDCSSSSNEDRVRIDQGVWGEVMFWEGDFMPMHYPDEASGDVSPVARRIFIHEATRSDQVQWIYVDIEPCCGARFISGISTDLLAVTHSDNRGFFQIELPPGRYSMFVEERGYLYANRFDGEYIFPFEVREKEVTGIEFDITYMAYY